MRITMRTLAGLTILAGLAGQASAQVKTEDVLARKPVQPNVLVTTPAGPDLAACKAEQVTWPKGSAATAPTGVVVKDAQGRLVRQFIDTTGSNDPAKANIRSFYLNGVEAYREIDANGNGKPDQFRWLGPNGGKWGADVDEDGTIDVWYALSPEELSQELLQAIVTRNAKRIEAMLPTDHDYKTLGIPDADVAKMKERAAGAVKKMMDAAEAMKLSEQAKWVHLELGLPQVTPADAFGGREDLVKHRSATVLVDKGDGKAVETFQTGEIVLIGRAWKLIDGPTPGGAAPVTPEPGGPEIAPVPQEAQKYIDILAKIQPPADPNDRAGMAKYHLDRAAQIEEVLKITKGDQQTPWLRQVIDSYAGAAESGNEAALQRLQQWIGSIEQTAPKSSAAAYAAFRSISAEYGVKLSKMKPDSPPDELAKVQGWWRERLEAFVNKYPAAEDAPEAINRLAVALEYTKDGEAAAKQWYERLAKDHPNHPYAAKAQGAVKRLGSEGQPFTLTGQTLDGKPFSPANVAGKAVIVYYWASWGRDPNGELKQLAELAKAYGPKGLEIVTINLDDEPAKAVAGINAAQLLGTGSHLHAPGGLERSPLAVAYGIQMVPHVFLVGKDGKVVNRNAQLGGMIKDEVEKLLK